MFTTSVYDEFGLEITRLNIDDDLHYVEGRVHKGRSCYYKGVGLPYRSHSIIDISDAHERGYEVLHKSGVFYLGHKVIKQCFVGKVGIFNEQYQPFFPDMIGSCSVKEGTIVLNSLSFERSSVEVLDCISIDAIEDQFYYVLDYHCARHRYTTHEGDPRKLEELLRYMITTGWNFLWDKGAINDISADGRVSDVADLFQSTTIEHQFGTIYSVLYSLGKLSPKQYVDFLKVLNLQHINDSSFVFNSVSLLKRFGVDVSPLLPHADKYENYKHIVTNYLIVGKNCAYCACDLFKDQGDRVRDTYRKITKFS